jgi:DNA-directed RNA polymerase specialized sigma24 family protein
MSEPLHIPRPCYSLAEVAEIAECYREALCRQLENDGYRFVDAEDAVSVAICELISLSQRSIGFESRKAIYAYLRRGSVNRARDLVRRSHRAARLSRVEHDADDPQTLVQSREESDWFLQLCQRAAKNPLGEIALEVLSGRLTYRELARRAGISERHARRVVLKGIREIRQIALQAEGNPGRKG